MDTANQSSSQTPTLRTTPYERFTMVTPSPTPAATTNEADTPTQPKQLVGNLRDERDYGCGCYASFTKADHVKGLYIFHLPWNGMKLVNGSYVNPPDDLAYMNIDGIDTELKLVGETKPKREGKIGSRSTSRYSAGDITVDVVQVATKFCGPRDGESCETTDYATTFTVKNGNRSKIVRAFGSCGC